MTQPPLEAVTPCFDLRTISRWCHQLLIRSPPQLLKTVSQWEGWICDFLLGTSPNSHVMDVLQKHNPHWGLVRKGKQTSFLMLPDSTLMRKWQEIWSTKQVQNFFLKKKKGLYPDITSRILHCISDTPNPAVLWGISHSYCQSFVSHASYSGHVSAIFWHRVWHKWHVYQNHF